MSRRKFKLIWKAVVSTVIERQLILSTINAVWLWYAIRALFPAASELSFWTFFLFVPVIGFGVGVLKEKINADFDLRLQEIVARLEEPE